MQKARPAGDLALHRNQGQRDRHVADALRHAILSHHRSAFALISGDYAKTLEWIKIGGTPSKPQEEREIWLYKVRPWT